MAGRLKGTVKQTAFDYWRYPGLLVDALWRQSGVPKRPYSTTHEDSLSTVRHEKMENYKWLASFRFLYLHYMSKAKLNILKFEADLLKCNSQMSFK